MSNHYHEFIKKGYLQIKHKIPFIKKNIISHYNFSGNKILTTNQKFNKYTQDCQEKY